MNDLEKDFKEKTIEAFKKDQKPKNKRGRPAKKQRPQLERNHPVRPSEREKIRALVVKYFGNSHVDKALLDAMTVKEQGEILRRLKIQMEQELAEAEIELKEYYARINEEYKKVGRPKSVFNWRELEYLCSINCTLDEMAGFFQCGKATILQKVKEEFGIPFSEYYAMHSQGVKVSLRRRQIQAAMEGDVQMLKFLGKNLLGQKEKVDFDGEVKVNSWVDLVKNLENKPKEPESEPEE
jgi:hypothetical protein